MEGNEVGEKRRRREEEEERRGGGEERRRGEEEVGEDLHLAPTTMLFLLLILRSRLAL